MPIAMRDVCSATPLRNLGTAPTRKPPAGHAPDGIHLYVYRVYNLDAAAAGGAAYVRAGRRGALLPDLVSLTTLRRSRTSIRQCQWQCPGGRASETGPEMLELSNSALTVHILHPVEDAARNGSRYCHGGYVWQVEATGGDVRILSASAQSFLIHSSSCVRHAHARPPPPHTHTHHPHSPTHVRAHRCHVFDQALVGSGGAAIGPNLPG